MVKHLPNESPCVKYCDKSQNQKPTIKVDMDTVDRTEELIYLKVLLLNVGVPCLAGLPIMLRVCFVI